MFVKPNCLPESIQAIEAGKTVIDVFDEVENEAGAGDYAYLSNFFSIPFEYNAGFGSYIWPTAEHAFQASKTKDAIAQKYIRDSRNPGEAKMMGRRVRIRDDWEQVKARIMLNVVRAKFRQNPDIAALLVKTGDAVLIEGNSWHDQIWGSCACRVHLPEPGKNYLGKILMKVRDDLNEDTGRRE